MITSASLTTHDIPCQLFFSPNQSPIRTIRMHTTVQNTLIIRSYMYPFIDHVHHRCPCQLFTPQSTVRKVIASLGTNCVVETYNHLLGRTKCQCVNVGFTSPATRSIKPLWLVFLRNLLVEYLIGIGCCFCRCRRRRRRCCTNTNRANIPQISSNLLSIRQMRQATHDMLSNQFTPRTILTPSGGSIVDLIPRDARVGISSYLYPVVFCVDDGCP
mmetsp:Transcript_22430/g.48781  ORF Transcript_22430/g.48781 Transcript_22430/m.48781 type:complete len:215 (+) Transcript_22430:1904-2548(+)